MTNGELLTRWTVRLALLCYVAALALLIARRSPRTARAFWTIGCGLYLAHVACAFQAFHHWSHAAAYRETARQTRDLVGLDWGGGLLLNYLFTAIWTIDVAWWALDERGYARRSARVTGGVHAFMFFMAFNGAVVFPTGATRWAGIAACAALMILWYRSRSVPTRDENA